jgi:hydrogenase maturation factor
MCLSVPLRVVRVRDKNATVEGDISVQLTDDLRVRVGDYLQLVGGVAVGSLSKKEGARVRKYLQSLETSV